MFDMAFGMDMMAQGAVDIEIGAFDMAMGRPLLGAQMMAVGTMDMNMGAGLMQIGAMQTGMMMRGGFIGAEMMAAERVMQAEVIGAEMRMMRGIGYCPVGCMDVCCRPIVNPMMQNQQVMIRHEALMQQQAQMRMQIAERQMLQQLMRVQEQRIQQQQRMMMQNQELMRQQQVMMQARKVQQEKMIQQKRMEQQIIYQQRIQQQNMMQRQQQQNMMQREQQQNMMQTNQTNTNVNPYTQTISQQTPQYQTVNQNNMNLTLQKPIMQGLLFMGKVQQLVDFNWQGPVDAQLTQDTFMNIKITSITKIKIKAQSKFNGTRLIKITTMNQDHLFSVVAQEQVEWMSKLIWAKINSMGKKCNLNDNYDGHIEGQIVKKSFFGDWQSKFGSISGPVFKISAALGSAPEKTISIVPQIWTRFDFVRGGMLVVKMHYGGRKLEIGIPIERAIEWLRGLFYTIRL